MKRSLLIPLFVAILVGGFAGPMYAESIFLRTTGVDPGSNGTFVFPVLGEIGARYGEYDLEIDWDMGAENYVAHRGFCVENAWASSEKGLEYELLDPSDTGMNYLYAAYILDQYLAGAFSTAQAAQIAVWEAVFDPGDFDVWDGTFRAVSVADAAHASDAQSFLNSMDVTGFDDSAYRIARNPPQSPPGTASQDYIIRVPDASTLLLLGSAFLLGFGVLGRRKRLEME